MCRLFAFVAHNRSTVATELGNDAVDRLTSLARFHGDGWGWSGLVDGQPNVQKSPDSALTDPDFAAALLTESRAAMVHLRLATLGLEIDQNNTHPFLVDGISFEHNGSLGPLARIEGMLSPASLRRLQGRTDSEMYFSLIREKRTSGISLSAATVMAARQLGRTFPRSSLNAILLDADELIVVHAHSQDRAAESIVTKIRQHNLAAEHAEDYYGLRWKTTPSGTILIGSTGIAGSDWLPMPDQSVVSIKLDTGVTSIEQLMSRHDSPNATLELPRTQETVS